MIELVFGLIIIALLAAFVLYVKESNAEKAKLINALVAKSPEQFRDLNLADKVAPLKPDVKPPDIIPLDQMTDEEFDNHIAQQLQ
jgi:hypothetical protein